MWSEVEPNVATRAAVSPPRMRSWTSPVTASPDDLLCEFEAVRALHRHWTERSGRTTVGVSGLEPVAALAYLQALGRGESPIPPHTGIHPAQLMRFAADDLKALYLEAASNGAGNPNGVQLRGWFWAIRRSRSC